ncbi:hypothetical protein [Massilia sp. ST3]|uniref:hypothetical protein n=1 Tax=Massilia sp. ST3 TaxID=2824903 RepID=UPI001B823533|nr:hypothetical protein [Massilia sp. ST3]MBQ5947596.1 hypothetical protein [Massilia sp. ST3]
MKGRIMELAAKIDALSLRERGLMFAAVVAVIVFLAHSLALGPLLRDQDTLRDQIAQQRNNMMGLDGEITAKVQAYQVDPDAPARDRLAAIKEETARLNEALLAMEHGLVPPERMAPLVESILKANGRLKLVSLRTLPSEPLSGAEGAGNAPSAAPPASAPQPAPGTPGAVLPPAAPAPGASPSGAAAPKQADLLYRHGVEVTVRGNYLDMVDYMSALETMPTRLFWGKAQLDVEEYPASRLTLTLYTLSLDRKWMKL